MSNHVTRSGFDFRPASYFSDLDPATLVVASILGEERRKDVQGRLASGDFDPLVWGEWLTDSKLDESTRSLLGQRHPRFMGGEYLPKFGEEEIEIARIVLASVTQDVISVRARRAGKRIAYRVVDEYGTKFKVAKKWSAQPLTLKEMISFINKSNQEGDSKPTGLVFSVLDWNIEGNGDPESMRDFIAVSSSFYPELAQYYGEEIEDHLDRLLADQCDEEAETD
jgi:hypothetical protein